MHQHFSRRIVRDAPGTRELFAVPAHEARSRLRQTDSSLRVGHEKTERLFKDRNLRLYLFKLFQLSGLYGSLDLQGAWTLSLLPKTTGGRWFTLNIGPHEVAFSTLKPTNGKVDHYLILDRLILDYPDTIIWIGTHEGEVRDSTYASAKRAVTISFREDFASAERLFSLPGVRRALIAYWAEALADLRERRALSVYARYHSYDAVSELVEYRRVTEDVFVRP
jgi:hypothetical protein